MVKRIEEKKSNAPKCQGRRTLLGGSKYDIFICQIVSALQNIHDHKQEAEIANETIGERHGRNG